MPPNYKRMLQTIKYIITYIIPQTIVRVFIFCFFAKATIHPTTEIQDSICGGTGEDNGLQIEPERRERKAMSEEEFLVTSLHRSKTSAILNYDWAVASMRDEKKRQRQIRREKQKQVDIKSASHETYAPLGKLLIKRKGEKERLKELRLQVWHETGRLSSWKHLEDRIPLIFTEDHLARKSAERNFPIGRAQQIHLLRDMAQDLRSRIYDASEGSCDLGVNYMNGVPIGRRMMLLMDMLERLSRKTFEAERMRLEKMKCREEEGRKDSCVVWDSRRKSSTVAINPDRRKVIDGSGDIPKSC